VLLEAKVPWPRPWAHGRTRGMDVLVQSAEAGGDALLVERVAADGTVQARTRLMDLPATMEFAGITHDGGGRAFVSAPVSGTPSKVVVFRESVTAGT
jgi:hypothetical protein